MDGRLAGQPARGERVGVKTVNAHARKSGRDQFWGFSLEIRSLEMASRGSGLRLDVGYSSGAENGSINYVHAGSIMFGFGVLLWRLI